MGSSAGDFCALLALVAIVLAIIFVVVLVEEFTRTPMARGEGVVVSKHFVSAHTTVVPCGKAIIPRYVPDEWFVTVDFEGKQVETGVCQSFYNAVEPGTRVAFIFTRSLLFGCIRIEEIRIG